MYIHNPDSISVNDIGLTVSINIFTSQAMYYKETNVQGTSGTTTSTPAQVVIPDTEIMYASAYNIYGQRIDIALVVKNNGDTTQNFDVLDALGNGELCTTDFNSHFFACVGVTTVTDYLPLTTYSAGSIVIQTYTLNEESGTVTLAAGDTAIVYFMGVQPASFTGFLGGNTATVGIYFDSGLQATKTATVVDADD